MPFPHDAPVHHCKPYEIEKCVKAFIQGTEPNIVQLRTHVVFGLLFGALLHHSYRLDLGFIFLTGFASLLPDIDWSMQFRWGLGSRHRTFMHNIWAMLIIAGIVYYVIPILTVFLCVVLGYASHLLADSFTVRGVSWLYPYEGRFHLRGPLSMSSKIERKLERLLQSLLFGMAGLLFLSKDMKIDLFSLEGSTMLVVLIFVGYVLMREIDKL